MPSKTAGLIYEIVMDICGILSSVLTDLKILQKTSYPDDHIRIVFLIRV